MSKPRLVPCLSRLCVALGLASLMSACAMESDVDALEGIADSEAARQETHADGIAAEPTWVIAYHEKPDDSVRADLEYLSKSGDVRVIELAELTQRLDAPAETAHPTILVEYLGKGAADKTAEIGPPPEHPVDEEAVRRADARDYVSLTGANMASRNRFTLHIPQEYLDEFGALTPWIDPNAEPEELDLAAHAGIEQSGDQAVADAFADPSVPTDPQHAWSNNYDSRTQIYGTNAAVGGVNEWLVHLSNNCSAAMVGARHIVTAAHCVTPLGGNGTSWFLEDRVARVARNGTSNGGAITIDTDAIPPGEVAWWWTSTGWTDGTAGGVADFSIVTLPGSFGCQSFNGQCNFAYSFTSNANLLEETTYERGYPVCDPWIQSGQHRIDEPCQNNSQTPASCSNYGDALCTTPCRSNHVYGQALGCGWGDFSDSGRRFWHGCDISAGDSGAPVYFNKNGTWTLAGVHYFSDCGTSCSDSCAGKSRPARATRITQNRRSQINWFVTNWPNY